MSSTFPIKNEIKRWILTWKSTGAIVVSDSNNMTQAKPDVDVEAQEEAPMPSTPPVAQAQAIVPVVQATSPPPTSPSPPTPMSASATQPPPYPFRWGRTSHYITCPHCQQAVHTQVHHQITAITWLLGCLMFCFGWFFLLCCVGIVPCMMPQFQETRHTCPNCKHQVAEVGVLQ